MERIRKPHVRIRAPRAAGAVAWAALAFAVACPLAIAADPAPAMIETPLRDPWVPPESRVPPTAPPTRGAELRAQVDRKLAAAFDAADVAHTGTLTRAQAQAAGLGFVARHFDEIDTQRSGVVRFDDVRRYLDANRERANVRR